MFALDTNIILRYIIGDGGDLFEQAKEIFEQIKASEIQAEIPIYIITEIIFVLQKYYNIPVDIITEHVTKIFFLPGIIVQEREQIITALQIYEQEKIDLADALLVAYARISHVEILSFDKQVNKLLEK